MGEREIVLVIDDTSDRKKGQHTDYVKRQYIGNLGKIENGIVAVTAYAVVLL
jgi:SRSO17 transposase